MADLCCHCKIRRPRRGGRGLCWTCHQVPGVRSLYPSESKYAPKAARGKGEHTGEPTDDELDRACEEMLREHPLWKPSPYYPSDPRYNDTVRKREAAGLPARHPGDPPASLD